MVAEFCFELLQLVDCNASIMSCIQIIT